jgi:hypothetical protein
MDGYRGNPHPVGKFPVGHPSVEEQFVADLYVGLVHDEPHFQIVARYLIVFKWEF